MFGEFMVAHLIGKARGNEERFRFTEKVVTRMGFICFCPLIFNLDEYYSYPNNGRILDDMCGAKLEVADFCVLVTPDHVGESTTMRILQSIDMGKPVFELKDGKLVPYSYVDNDQYHRVMKYMEAANNVWTGIGGEAWKNGNIRSLLPRPICTSE